MRGDPSRALQATLKLPPEASPGGTPGRAPGGPPEAKALGYGPAVLKSKGFYNITPSAVNAIPVNTPRAFPYKFGFLILILYSLEVDTVTTCLTEKMQISHLDQSTENSNLLK